MSTSAKAMTLQAAHFTQIINHLDQQYPLEACGFVAGEKGTSTWVYPIENILKSPTRFEMNPQQQIKAMIEIDEKNLALLAIYHSHPNGPAVPSPTDIQANHYSECYQLIFSRKNTKWNANGFIITENKYDRIALNILKL